jgi:hypothetical protein
MTNGTTEPHTLWQATPPTRIQSQPKSVLNILQVEKVANEKCPTARLTNEEWSNINV